jgi:hypothetical protein
MGSFARAVALTVAATVGCSRGRGDDASVTQLVGEAGGVLSVGDVTLEIPPGALSSQTSVTITRTADPAPQAYEPASALYRFDPDGLVFAKPATVGFAAMAPSVIAAIVWSTGADAFAPLPTTFADGRARAGVSHFSRGFLGTPACAHATSCAEEGAACTFFEARCDGAHPSEKRDDCTCAMGAWSCAVHATPCVGAACVLDQGSTIDSCVVP